MLRKPFIALVSICVIASGAQAARLTDIEGTVLVNTGEGFREVNGKTVVSAGDRVLVRGKGGARIDYGAGCVTPVLANQTVVIAAEPTCKQPPLPVSMKEAAPVKETPAPPPFNDGLAEQRILIVGGLVVVGSAAAALGSKGDDQKARPSAPVPETPAPVVLNNSDGEKQSPVETGMPRVAAANPAAGPLPAATATVLAAGGGDIANAAAVNRIQPQPAEAHAAAAIAFNSGELADGSPVSP